jgi:hypothetical protein
MWEAEKSKDWDNYTSLSLEKERMQGITGQTAKDIQKVYNDPQFQTKDANGNTVFKMDSEYGSLLKSQIDTMKKLIAAQEEAVRNGEMDKVHELSPQIQKAQSDFHKTVEEATAQPGMKVATQNALLNAISAQQIVGAVTNGINTYVSQLDRSSIVNREGSGDVMGAQVEELHRDATRKSGIWGSVGTIGGGILGGILGTIIAPGAGTAAGVALGSTIGGGFGGLAGIGDEAKANTMATDEAYAQQWEKQAPGTPD